MYNDPQIDGTLSEDSCLVELTTYLGNKHLKNNELRSLIGGERSGSGWDMPVFSLLLNIRTPVLRWLRQYLLVGLYNTCPPPK